MWDSYVILNVLEAILKYVERLLILIAIVYLIHPYIDKIII